MKKIILPVFVLASSLFISSCTKQGCMDSSAKNYNSKANSSDNSCLYEEKLIFWQSQTSAQEWLSTDVTVIKWYIDGQYISSHAVTEYTPSQPTCSSSDGQLNKTIDLGSSKTKVVQVEIKDQDNISLGIQNVTITAGACHIEEF